MKGHFHKIYFHLLLTIAGSLFFQTASAQLCTPDYFFKHYEGNRAVYTARVIVTPQDDIVTAGAVLKERGDFEDATDGWVTRLSPRGSVLWSKRYFMPGFNSGRFLTIEQATDSTYLATARYGKYVKRNNNQVEEIDAAAFIVHLDKFGNIIWVKRISQYIDDSFLSSLTRLQGDKFLIAGNIYGSSRSELLLLNIDLSGTVFWSKIMYVDSTQLGSPVVKQLSNGQVIITGVTVRYGPNFSTSRDHGYYFFKLDPVTESFNRTTGIFFNRVSLDRPVAVEGIRDIMEISPDTLIFATSFSELQLFGINPGSKEALLIKTGNNGQVYKADIYYNTLPGCRLKGAKYKNGKYDLLVDDGFKSFLTQLNRGGEIISQKAYGNAFSLLQGYALLDGSPASRALFDGRGQYPLLGLMKSENDGSIPCVETPSQMVSGSVLPMFSTGNLDPGFVIPSFPFTFEDIGQSISWAHYNFNTTTDCIITCCDNIRSDTTYTDLCNSTSYRLPDNSVVRESGMYYMNVKNANNCDSIAYYDIQFLKKPLVDLGEDTCFINNTPIVLRADSGYTTYNWMGRDIASHTYTATTPGNYTLSISNQCGTGVDEIIIYEDCEFPVYMPTGFTPGNDGLNDYYNYPVQNKNRLISLDIYNRFGQRVFYTTDRSKGWNGKLKNLEQPTGIFVYILRVETLDGRPLVKKGSFALIRQ
jgi:gliding motility-associated-like protein